VGIDYDSEHSAADLFCTNGRPLASIIVVKLALFVLAAPGLWAAEEAVLRTGFRITADRHEQNGEMVRLYAGAGVIELPAAAIASFEPLETVAPPPAPVAAAPAIQPPPKKPSTAPRDLVERAAERHGLPPALLHSVARIESGYQPDAISPKGAVGIMQLMPATAAMLNADPRDPEQNVEAGARHLRDLLVQYNGDSAKALAAYNAGAGAVARYNGVPPYAETQNYVDKVLRNYWQLAGQPKR
jgi:soluble lytic murein transglycosylase-like protein